MVNFKTIKLFNLILFAVFFFSGCNNVRKPTIPDSPVNIRLNLTTTYNTFNAPLQYHIFEKRNDAAFIYNIGYGGILVHIDYQSIYQAYDLSCPYEKEKDVKVHPDESGAFAVCEKCGSTFDLAYGEGYVEKGPATEHLTHYRTSKQYQAGSWYLYISRY